MKKNDLGQTLNTLANIGVIAGIVFLVIELDQNNNFLELEAKATRAQIFLDGRENIARDPDLAVLLIRDRNEEVLSDAEELQLSAYWMGYFIRREWVFENVPSERDRRTDALRRIYHSYGSLRRAWNGESSGSRSAGKDNFSAEFVDYVESIIAAPE